ATGRSFACMAHLRIYFHIHRNNRTKKGSGRLLVARADRVGAAFIDQVADEPGHRRIVRPAEEGRGLALLRDQSCLPEVTDVMREGRGREPDLLLKDAAWQTVFAGAHERPIDLQAHRTAQRLKLVGCYFEFHRNNMTSQETRRKNYFDQLRNL